MKRFETDYELVVDEKRYPIYFIEMDNDFGLDCEVDLPLDGWYKTYHQLLYLWGAGELKEVDW